MGWSEKYKKSIDCDNPKGFSQRAHCQGKKKKMDESKSGDQGLRDWFGKSKSSDGKPGWVQLGGKWSGKPCARQPGQTSTPKCGSSKMKRDLSSKEEESARKRKNRLDPNQPEKSGGAKPTNVRTEEMDLQEVKDKPGKGSGEKDACYHKVKSRYDVWPSAYASGALVKCRKVGAKNWGTQSEDCWDGYEQRGMKKKGKKMVPNCVPVKEEQEMIRYCPKCKKDETRNQCKYGPRYWDTFSVPSALTPNQMNFDVATIHPANEEKDHEYSMARSEISTIISAAKRLKRKMKGEGNIEAWVQSKITKAADYIDTAADYLESGEHKVNENNQLDEIAPAVLAGGAAAAMAAPYLLKKFVKPKIDKALDGARSSSPISGDRYKEQMKKLRTESSFEINKSAHRTAQRKAKVGELIKKAGTEGEGAAAMAALRRMGGPGAQLIKFADSYEYSNWRADFGISEDWQKVNRQDKTDGLSQKAVNAYRRENPGSKLQTAVTEKNPSGKRAQRRKNFCSRMGGMKDRLTSTKTARDPDSRINKALRRWRCN
jgi:hypothetical protein